MSDKSANKRCIYLNDELLEATLAAAAKDERSFTYVVGQALTFWLAAGCPAHVLPLGRKRVGGAK